MARPNLSYLKNLILAIVGIPCGFLTGLSGIGSSTLVGTGVRYLLGLRDSRASGAALLTTLASTLGCLIAYTQVGASPWFLAIMVTVGQIIGAALGQNFRSKSSKIVLWRPLLSVLVIALGLYMMVTRSHVHALLNVTGILLMLSGFSIGVIIGLVSGILEIGGVLTVPAALYILGVPVLAAQGLSILVLLLASLPTALIYLSNNALEARSASWIPFGAVFGALVGAHYATTRIAPGMLIDVDGLVITLFGLYHLLSRPNTPVLVPVNPTLDSE